MHYFVCIDNCYEDYINETLDSVRFENYDEAEIYVKENRFSGFDICGNIRWYFPSCEKDGKFHEPGDFDELECYQIINIIPSEEQNDHNKECYGHDKRSIFSVCRRYLLKYTGECTWYET